MSEQCNAEAQSISLLSLFDLILCVECMQYCIKLKMNLLSVHLTAFRSSYLVSEGLMICRRESNLCLTYLLRTIFHTACYFYRVYSEFAKFYRITRLSPYTRTTHVLSTKLVTVRCNFQCIVNHISSLNEIMSFPSSVINILSEIMGNG